MHISNHATLWLEIPQWFPQDFCLENEFVRVVLPKLWFPFASARNLVKWRFWCRSVVGTKTTFLTTSRWGQCCWIENHTGLFLTCLHPGPASSLMFPSWHSVLHFKVKCSPYCFFLLCSIRLAWISPFCSWVSSSGPAWLRCPFLCVHAEHSVYLCPDTYHTALLSLQCFSEPLKDRGNISFVLF